jgi:hypothetical protein
MIPMSNLIEIIAKIRPDLKKRSIRDGISRYINGRKMNKYYIKPKLIEHTDYVSSKRRLFFTIKGVEKVIKLFVENEKEEKI